MGWNSLDEWGGRGALFFVLILANGLLCIRHYSIDGKDFLSYKKRKKTRAQSGLYSNKWGEKKKKSAKKQRSERKRVWIDPTQANIVNYSA